VILSEIYVGQTFVVVFW